MHIHVFVKKHNTWNEPFPFLQVTMGTVGKQWTFMTMDIDDVIYNAGKLCQHQVTITIRC